MYTVIFILGNVFVFYGQFVVSVMYVTSAFVLDLFSYFTV